MIQRLTPRRVPVQGGFNVARRQTGITANLFGSIEPSVPLDAAVLFKNTGVQLASWTRDAVPPEVVTVMASTLLASTEVLLENLGDVRPASFFVETDHRCILFHRIDSQVILALIAPRSVARGQLREQADRLAKHVQSAMAQPGPESGARREKNTVL